MPRYIFEANLAHFKARLADETNPETIAMLRELLAEEKVRLAEYDKHNSNRSKAAE